MIRRANQTKHGAPPADLLVCFPSRAHLTLMPKKLSSPARLMDHTFGQRHRSQLKKLPSTRLGQTSSSPPDSWDKAKRAGSDVSEPSSPKVTCAGQIKVRPRSAAANCKSWQSVMEEIERIHKKSKNEKKRARWGDALGIKKEVMQFLTCLRNVKLDFRCFGAPPECDLSSEEDEDGDEEYKNGTDHKKNVNQPEFKEDNENAKDSRKMFSNWFMVVQENQQDAVVPDAEETASAAAPPPPPPNALLLMRCRSAPAQSWLESRAKAIVEQEERDKELAYKEQQQEEEENDDEDEKVETEEKGMRKKLRDYLLVMEYDTEFYKLSNDIAKETWVVGSINPFSRSRSWKR